MKVLKQWRDTALIFNNAPKFDLRANLCAMYGAHAFI
jgi:hypothetical protein